MKAFVPILLLSFCVLLAPANAQVEEAEVAAEEAVTDVVEEEDPSQRIRCRMRRVTGSNARRIRTCLTMAEWSELARSGNRDARRVLDQSTRDSSQRN